MNDSELVQLARRLRGVSEAVKEEYLLTPRTSADWDGDARSTAAKTLLDMPGVFGTPETARALLVRVAVRDSGSAGGDYWFMLSPNDTAGSGLTVRCSGLPNDVWTVAQFVTPCAAGGQLYWQAAASGAGTLDVSLQVWGYFY